jgi:lipopolysaccharide export system permease protein
MNRIARYIFVQLLVATLVVTLTITCAIWLTQSLRFIELIVNRGLSIGSYLYLTILLLPSFIATLMPIGLFAAVLFTYNRLTVDSELIVMRAVGLGPWRLGHPALVLTAFVIVVGYILALFLMPISYRQFKDMETNARSEYTAVLFQEGAFNTIGDGITVYIRSREPDGGFRGIIVHDSRDKDKIITIMAERGVLASTADGPRLILVNGNRQVRDRDTGKLQLLYFERYSTDIGKSGGVDSPVETRWREPRERFIQELLAPGDSQMDRINRSRLIAEGHNRIATPLYALVFTLIALAALVPGDYNRRGQGKRVIAAIVAAVAVQSLSVLWSGLAARYPALLPMIYINVLAPAAAALWYLLRVPRLRQRRDWAAEAAA